MGDIHQPLHTGFARDAGGTGIPLSDPEMSLHDLWDFELINHLKPQSPAGSWNDVGQQILTLLSRDRALYDQIVSPVSDIESFLETHESRREYASILASETSTQTTCQFAYQDETGRYIVPHATISKTYFTTRGKIVILQLAKAGVRLADLINTVAELFYERKAELRAIASAEKRKAQAEQSSLAESAPSPSSSNMFSVLALDMEFDAEEICSQSSESFVGEEDGAAASVPGKKSAARRKGKSRKTVVRKPEDEAKEDTDDAVLPSSVPDLSKATLIKRKGQYYITSVDLVTPEYLPVFFNTFKVVFTKNASPEPISFHFDSAMFGKRQISKERVVETMSYLRSGELQDLTGLDEPESLSGIASVQVGGYIMPNFGLGPDKSGYMGSSVGDAGEVGRRLYIRNLIGKRRLQRLKVAHRQRFLAQLDLVGADKEFKTISEKWDYEFFSKLNKIVVFLYKHIQIFIHVDSLTNTHMRFSEHNGVYKGGNIMMLVDTNIYDGDLTPRIKKGLEIACVRSEELSRANRDTRPSLGREMIDIELMFFDTDPDRLSRVRLLNNFVAYPGDDESSYFVFEWDLFE